MSGAFLAGFIARAAVLATAALLATSARAEEAAGAPGAPKEKLPRFTVELIVFTYTDAASAGGEIFVPKRPPVDPYLAADSERGPDAEYVFSDVRPGTPDRAVSPPPQGSAIAVDDFAPAAEITGIDENLNDIPLRAQIELHLLEPEQYTMNEIYDKLVELDAYQPIMRAAWTQTTPAEDVSPAIQLRALGSPPPGLDGTVKLYQGRFVHLGLDLELDAEAGDGGGAYDERESATDRAIAYGDGRTGSDEEAVSDDAPRNGSGYEHPVYSDRDYDERGFGDAGGFFRQPVRYRIAEVRIMKNGEVRYYDHPRFGVIAKLTEVKDEDDPADGEESAAENPLAGLQEPVLRAIGGE